MRARRAGLSLVFGGCLLACHQQQAPHRQPPEPPSGEVWMTPAQIRAVSLRLKPVVEGPVAAPVLASGRITFDEKRVGHVLPPITGRVMRIEAALGSHVQAGAPLAQISSPDLGQVVADASRAHADLLTARRDFERQRTLYEGHAAAQKDYEAAHNRFLQAEAEYERAHKKAKLLGGNENQTTDTYVVRAPLEGDVVARAISPGMEVQGQYDGGSTVPELFTIGSLDSVWAVADVFEMDLSRIDANDAAEVSVVAYPDKVFPCRISYIASAIAPETRSAQVRCALDNREHKLKPEMFITMRVLSDHGRSLLIPRRALLRYEGHTVAFVALPGDGPGGQKRFARRTVVAQEDAYGEMVPVSSGLAAGEEVVAEGSVLLLGN